MPLGPNTRLNIPAPSKGDLQHIGEVVRENGGGVLPDECRSRDIAYPIKAPGKGRVVRFAESCGCNGLTRIAHKYHRAPDKIEFATLCAICDGVGQMPVFRR